jgi:hypothetical protein
MINSTTAQTKTPTNKHFWHTVETTASPEEIWNIWTDVPNWQLWDTGLKQAELFGDFNLNSKGIITSLEGRKSKFKIVEFNKSKSYTFKTNLPLAGLYVKRKLEIKGDKTFFTHEVWFKGITAHLFARSFGSKFKAMLPEVMNNIKKLAEKN